MDSIFTIALLAGGAYVLLTPPKSDFPEDRALAPSVPNGVDPVEWTDAVPGTVAIQVYFTDNNMVDTRTGVPVPNHNQGDNTDLVQVKTYDHPVNRKMAPDGIGLHQLRRGPPSTTLAGWVYGLRGPGADMKVNNPKPTKVPPVTPDQIYPREHAAFGRAPTRVY